MPAPSRDPWPSPPPPSSEPSSLSRPSFRLLHVSVGTVQINRATVRRSSDERLSFDLRPGARVQAEVEYRINALGLRGPETTVAKPPGARRIAVLGDSIAFGYWVAEPDAFPRQLELLLGQVRGPGPAVEVLNFGVPGYNLDQEIEVLRTRALDFEPDVVVIAFCLNDLEGTSHELGLVQDRSSRERRLLGRVREALLARSTLFSWIEYRMAEMEARRGFVRTRNPLPERLYPETIDQQRAGLAAQMAVRARSPRAPRHSGDRGHLSGPRGALRGLPPSRPAPTSSQKRAATPGSSPWTSFRCYSAYDFHDLRVDVVHPSPWGTGSRPTPSAMPSAAGASSATASSAARPACSSYRKEDFAVVRGY